MERIRWFSCDENTNSLSLSSIDALAIIPFLQNLDFLIIKVTVLKNNAEHQISNSEEENFWIRINHHIHMSSLIEETDCHELHSINIELENGGSIVFEFGQLIIQYPPGADLKERMVSVFKTYGFFAGKEIWEFASQHKEPLLLDWVLAMQPTEITDEFERMLAHSKTIPTG